MKLVSLPAGPGWHFANVNEIVAVKYAGPKKATVLLAGGVALECTEETHSIHKRIEDCIKLAG